MVPKFILIFDDDPIGLKHFQSLLNQDYHVYVAEKQQHLLEYLEQGHYFDVLCAGAAFWETASEEFLRQLKDVIPHLQKILLFKGDLTDKYEFQKANKKKYPFVISKPFNANDIAIELEKAFVEVFRVQKFENFVKRISHFKNILSADNLRTYFQPIVDFNDLSILGHEVFTRGPTRTPFKYPQNLIDLAHQAGLIYEFENSALKKAFYRLRDMNATGEIFLNSFPSLILNANLQSLEYFQKIASQKRKIVIEIIEAEKVDYIEDFIVRIDFLKSQGFKISIDDVGQSASSFYLVEKVKPDYIKLHMHLVRNIHQNQRHRFQVRNLINFARQHSVQVIAEGVEKEAEYKTLREMGVVLGQGYYFSKPHPWIAKSLKNIEAS